MTNLRRGGLWLPTRAPFNIIGRVARNARRHAGRAILDAIIDRELLLTRERASKLTDIRELQGLLLDIQPWKPRMQELWIDGVPCAIAGGLAGLEQNPPQVAITTTINGTEQNVFTGANSATNTPVPAYAQTPKAFYLESWGTRTSAATPGTETYNPRVGTTLSGITMGISTNLTPTASETAVPYRLSGVWLLRNGGTTAAVATGNFRYIQGPSTSGNGAETSPLIFGGGAVSASIDNTVAQALYMGAIAATSTTNTMVLNGLIHGSWN